MLPPRKPGIPSQQRSQRRPYYPTVQQDVAALQPIIGEHEPGVGEAPSAFVITTFDARPINAADFQTQSGTNADDTGYVPGAGTQGPGNNAYITTSIFYTVPAGYQAILRDFQILCIPASGSDLFAGNPIFGPSGESNFPVIVSILVDGVYQNGVAGVNVWSLAFGDFFADCYVLANAGSTIEIRVDQNNEQVSWYQMIINAHGNLLLSQSGQLEFAPATHATIPVADQQARSA